MAPVYLLSMGHARIDNISRIFNKMVKRPNGASIREIVDELDRRKTPIHASEGVYHERYMLGYMTQDIACRLARAGLLKPARLTAKQKPIYRDWLDEDADIDDWDSGEDGEGGEYGILDSIRQGNPMPTWTALPEAIRRHWTAAAYRAIHLLTPKSPGRLPDHES
jgi:hypothetical protein